MWLIYDSISSYLFFVWFLLLNGKRFKTGLQSKIESCENVDQIFTIKSVKHDACNSLSGYLEGLPGCRCGDMKITQVDCQVQHLRRYLPSHGLAVSYYEQCDRLLSVSMERWLLQHASDFKPSLGYPRQDHCLKQDIESNEVTSACPLVSIGKYLRYNVMMQYHHLSEVRRYSLFEVSYPFIWPWIQNVPECEGLTTFGGWNCVFKYPSELIRSFPASHPSHNHSHLGPIDDRLIQKVFRILQTHPSHAIQILFYGKVLNLLSMPSDVVQSYLMKHLRIHFDSANASTPSLNSHSSRTHSSAFQDIASSLHLHPLTTKPVNATDPLPPIRHRPPRKGQQISSVSMQVRQGDSCDATVSLSQYLNLSTLTQYQSYLDQWQRTGLPPRHPIHRMKVTQYLSKVYFGSRPCFAIEVYLWELVLVKRSSIYPDIQTVYLSTDSTEMIQWIEGNGTVRSIDRDPLLQLLKRDLSGIEWVYLQMNRTFFHRDLGWIDRRKDSKRSSLNRLVTFSAAADLYLLRFGRLFIGTFTSHYSKLAYYSMCGHHMKILPFISLDFPLSCDTIHRCDDESLLQRNMTVRDAVLNAVECTGNRFNESYLHHLGRPFGPHHDPCGIYSSTSTNIE